MRSQHVAASTVARTTLCGIVLAAVQFDDQTQFEAGKVCKVRTDWMLSPKSQTRQPSSSQPIPNARFCERLILSQVTREASLIVAKLHANSMR